MQEGVGSNLAGPGFFGSHISMTSLLTFVRWAISFSVVKIYINFRVSVMSLLRPLVTGAKSPTRSSACSFVTSSAFTKSRIERDPEIF